MATPEELIASINALADLLLAEASYSYEEIDVKRVIADADACEVCIDAEDMGWIEDSETYDGVFGAEDGPPLHPNCGCELEYGTRRHRVYD